MAADKLYQHRFDKIEGYLHHRRPYLLLDEIVSIEPERVIAQTTVAGDSFYAEGHFPGAPVLPGALMQEMTTQAGGVLIAANYNPMQEFCTEIPDANEFALGVLVRIKNARYRGFARPQDKLTIQVELHSQVGELYEFRGQITLEQSVIYKNEFQLTNMPSRQLIGGKR